MQLYKAFVKLSDLGKTAQWVNTLVTMSDDPTSVPGTCMADGNN